MCWSSAWDFAHLGIAFCRALTIPARYTTVYAYQLQPQDFHACFEAYINGEWYLFDAKNLEPLNGMIRISTGRDASDAAVATLFGEIQGVGLAEKCDCDDDNFQGVTRQNLQGQGNAFIVCSRGMGEKPSPLCEDFQYACGCGLSEIVAQRL